MSVPRTFGGTQKILDPRYPEVRQAAMDLYWYGDRWDHDITEGEAEVIYSRMHGYHKQRPFWHAHTRPLADQSYHQMTHLRQGYYRDENPFRPRPIPSPGAMVVLRPYEDQLPHPGAKHWLPKPESSDGGGFAWHERNAASKSKTPGPRDESGPA